jgi:hypothetical protein
VCAHLIAQVALHWLRLVIVLRMQSVVVDSVPQAIPVKTPVHQLKVLDLTMMVATVH